MNFGLFCRMMEVDCVLGNHQCAFIFILPLVWSDSSEKYFSVVFLELCCSIPQPLATGGYWNVNSEVNNSVPQLSWPHVKCSTAHIATGHYTGWHSCVTFPSLQKFYCRCCTRTKILLPAMWEPSDGRACGVSAFRIQYVYGHLVPSSWSSNCARNSTPLVQESCFTFSREDNGLNNMLNSVTFITHCILAFQSFTGPSSECSTAFFW